MADQQRTRPVRDDDPGGRAELMEQPMHDWSLYIVAAIIVCPGLAFGVWYWLKTGSGGS